MKNKKIISLILLSSFVVCAIFLVGCAETTTKSTLNSLMSNMVKVSNTLDNVQNIDNNELIISDFMNENELTLIDAKNDNLNQTNDAMKIYFSKISSLNNCVITTIDINNSLNNLKTKIYAKASQVKTLCTQSLDAKIELKNSQINTLQELNNNVIANNARISLTRNEITNNFKNVNNIKEQYSSKPEQLNSRYTKLKNSLNTRLSYYDNLLSCLDEITKVLCFEIDKPIYDDYIFEKDVEEQNVTAKTCITKNIDTYENAGTNIYGDYRNNPVYNPDNYLKNYNPGYGMNNPNFGNFGYGINGFNGYPNGMYPNGYGMNGYGMNGFGMNGYGLPYGNGYLYPNINTFGTYKNIDTYRSRKDLNKEQKNFDEERDNQTNKENINEPTSKQKKFSKKDIKKSNISKKILDEDDNEDHFVDNQNDPKIEQLKD